jgi:hypothetical protein
VFLVAKYQRTYNPDGRPIENQIKKYFQKHLISPNGCPYICPSIQSSCSHFKQLHDANRAVDATVAKQCGPSGQKSGFLFFIGTA